MACGTLDAKTLPPRWLLLALAALTSLPLGCRADGEALEASPTPRLTERCAYPDPPASRRRAAWPTARWPEATPSSVGLAESVERAAAYAFRRTGDERDRKGIRTDGLLIVRRGKLVFERYARGYGRERKHLAWSMTKSVVHALVGVAVRQGLLKLADPAHRWLPALRRPHARQITIRHLLRMTPGIAWSEGYESSFLESSVIAMLYSAGHRDMAGFVARQPMRHAPGTFWRYSSGDSNLLTAILAARLGGPAKLEAWVWRELVGALGMRGVTWERDGAGILVGSSYFYARPRDMARFGQLYLDDGVWQGKRLLPAGWVRFAATAGPANVKGDYGAHFWLNAGRPARGVKRRFPAAPADMFAARGHWGQLIVIVPSLDLVVVRTADDRDKSFSVNRFFALLLAGIAR
jgi:CubicO group peptidase (beta-lactamase class C family)